MEGMKASCPVPVFATVSRKTGEIAFGYSRDRGDELRFGQVMNRIGEMALCEDALSRRGGGTVKK